MSQPKHIIAFLGLPGSGKTEAVTYLMEKYHWPKVYFGDVTFREMAKRGLDDTQANERLVREELRLQFGKDHYAKEVMAMIDAHKEDVVLVESLYSWTEFQLLKRSYGERLVTIAVHARPQVRHARLVHRPLRPLTPDQATLRDVAQIEQLEQGGPIAMADHILVNEGSRDDFFAGIQKILASFISA
jgi:dephospho-CoA kinase